MDSNVESLPSELAPAVTGAGANVGSERLAPTNPQNAAGVNDTTPTVPAAPRSAAEQAKAANETSATRPNQGTALPNQSATTSNLQGGTPQGQAGGTGGQGTDAKPKGNPSGTSLVPSDSKTNNLTPPTAPAESRPAELPPELPPAANPPPGEVRRQSLRPSYTTRTPPPEFRNVLLGFVQSRTAGQREEGVRVIITDPSDPTRGKATVTDAFGRFAIKLTDGDWTVNVTMPSGRIYAVSQVRVIDGQITDTEGQRVPRLEITR